MQTTELRQVICPLRHRGSRRVIGTLCCAALLAAIAAFSRPMPAAAVTKAEDDFRLVEVASGIYAAIATDTGIASGNSGFIIGDDGVVVVDTTLTPEAAEELIGAIKAHTSLPIRFAVNTHYHLDHSGGNQVFAEMGVPIIGQERMRPWVATKNLQFIPPPDQMRKVRNDAAKKLAEIPADQKQQGAPLERRIRQLDALLKLKLTPPSVTYPPDGGITLYLGNRKVVLFSLPGHTGGDTVVSVPDAGVVFTGDLGWRKTLPNLVDATVSEWIPTLSTLVTRYPNAKFVPGHGDVAAAGDLREFQGYLEDLRTTVQQAVNDGLTLEQTAERFKLPEKYQGFAFQNFVKPDLENMYKEIKGTKKAN
ncbi:MAG TPA: MBL fold metallo-hydrolase [Blastocatellia bacterium]|nr:MBL fold metallo-hydrolase [Blastocatellia bacterium]